MFNRAIQLLLIGLILFTPLAFGSMEIWAYSLMELGIFLIVILSAVQTAMGRFQNSERIVPSPNGNRQSTIPMLLLALFLLLVLFQIVSLPSGLMKVLSPKTFEIRQSLSISNVDPSALRLEPSALSFPLSFFPFLTRIEFFKWLSLAGLFLFLLGW